MSFHLSSNFSFQSKTKRRLYVSKVFHVSTRREPNNFKLGGVPLSKSMYPS